MRLNDAQHVARHDRRRHVLRDIELSRCNQLSKELRTGVQRAKRVRRRVHGLFSAQVERAGLGLAVECVMAGSGEPDAWRRQ